MKYLKHALLPLSLVAFIGLAGAHQRITESSPSQTVQTMSAVGSTQGPGLQLDIETMKKTLKAQDAEIEKMSLQLESLQSELVALRRQRLEDSRRQDKDLGNLSSSTSILFSGLDRRLETIETLLVESK